MAAPSIAHGLFTWQDGRVALEASLRSTAGYVDHVLIADGLIDGVPDLGLPLHSDLSWLPEADWLPARVPISSRANWPGAAPWPSISAACSWLLGAARAAGADWLLYIDADQELHGGEYLADWLADWQGDAFPIQRVDGPGPPLVAPWQLIRVAAFSRYVSGCYILERADGLAVNLVPEGTDRLGLYDGRPWISHHPERRPPWRYAQRLGSLEAILEPPPIGVPILGQPPKLIQSADPRTPEAGGVEAVTETIPAPPVANTGAPPYYCPGCGARYFAPGVCSKEHATLELERDPDVPLPGGTVGDTGDTQPGPTREAAAPAVPSEAAAPPELLAALAALSEARSALEIAVGLIEGAAS